MSRCTIGLAFYFSGAHDFLLFTWTDGISQAAVMAARREFDTDLYKFTVQNQFDPHAAPSGDAHITRMKVCGQLKRKKNQKGKNYMLKIHKRGWW